MTAGEQSLLVLAHLRCGDSLAQLAGSFDVGTTTAYRYVGEAIAVLAEQAPGLGTALTSRWRHPVTILDGTLIPSQRVHALPEARGWYSGKHKRYGVNIQALTSGDGSLLWVSDALPGATHDLTAARHHQIIATAAELGVEVLADKGYQGAGDTTVTPIKGKQLPAAVRRYNTRHARKRARGERGFAILKTWRILNKLRSDVTAATSSKPSSSSSSDPTWPPTHRPPSGWQGLIVVSPKRFR